ncbi:hypothetical protein [Massilia sp. Leaf139]|uniref:hypothetical protein n=1 Tax=Massilia sp. Leaf139 TaxID=1736272 RepID=UPI0006F20910|nr:hypothetical protein [Massilia sp. Leaf139]KQQ87083.1 hypothetical protein ASF77_15840 [Massilia sp. Leaf139]
MTPLPRRLAPLMAILLAILASTLMATPAQVHEDHTAHLIHAYEGWAALAVVVLSLAGAGLLIRRALRR